MCTEGRRLLHPLVTPCAELAESKYLQRLRVLCAFHIYRICQLFTHTGSISLPCATAIVTEQIQLGAVPGSESYCQYYPSIVVIGSYH